MNEKDEEILEAAGWIVECYSPLEIKHEDTKSIATGIAVNLILESIKDKIF